MHSNCVDWWNGVHSMPWELLQVALECQLAAQLDEAVELYMAAKRPLPALAILNRRISNLMEDEARGVVNAQKVGISPIPSAHLVFLHLVLL